MEAMRKRSILSSVCIVRLLSLAGASIVAVGLLAASGRAATPATLGTNALPMRSTPATYRLSLDGTARFAGPVPPASNPSETSPSGRYRFQVAATGVALIDTRTGAQRILTTSLYAQRPYWSATGKLAFTDRSGGLTRLVVFDPATSTRRVVASHVCGDALVDPWAPDGRSLAVAVSPPHTGCNGHGGSVVAVADAVRAQMRRITTPQTTPIAWTRDGTRLLIAVRDSADATSRLIDPRTGKGHPVFPSYGSLANGAWSTTHRFFAGLSINLANRRQVLLVVNGALTRVIESQAYPTLYAWAPRRQWLAIANHNSIRVLNALTGRFVATIPADTPNGLSLQSITWAHDGNALSIVASPSLGHD
jgi:hypothetical protein